MSKSPLSWNGIPIMFNKSPLLYEVIVPPVPGIEDYDGNFYTEVVIGTQTWLTPNLKTTHWNNGSAIPKPANAAAWQADWNKTTGQMCYYDFNNANKDIWGGYYNWYVWSNSSDLCPIGYRLPVKADYQTLGGFIANVQQLMSIGTTYWTGGTPTPGIGTDVYGFDCRGAGDNDWNGAFMNLKTIFYQGYIQAWSGLYETAQNNGAAIGYSYIQTYQGCSLRCIKI